MGRRDKSICNNDAVSINGRVPRLSEFLEESGLDLVDVYKSGCWSDLVRRAGLAKYGLTPETYTETYESQQGLCAICHKPEIAKRRIVLAVDHDHRTGKVRELLCQKCNRLLSMVDDSVEFLNAYVAYLEKHRNKADA